MDLFNSKLLRREYSCQGKIDLISILGSSDKIIVESGDVANVMVSYPECPGKHEFVLTEQDGTLTLERKPITSFLWAVWQPFIDNGIRVTVPGGFRGGLGIKSSSGRISVSEINPERVNLECSSGAVTVENGNTGMLSIATSSGAVKISDVHSGSDVSVGCSSGMITMVNTIVAKDVSVDNHSGLIRLLNVSAGGSLKAGNRSGGIHFDSLKTGGNIDLSTNSGAIRGTIMGRESDYSIISHTTSGHNGLINSRTGEKQLNANATSGAIRISFLE